MILVETEVTDFTRRSRSLLVSHVATALPRGLEPGEVVVVRSGADHWTACVIDIDFTLEDTVYRLSLGGRIPADQAADLLADRGVDAHAVGSTGRSVEVTDVLAMLGSLRDSGREGVRVPAPRRAVGALVDQG
jgi:hypothetical protein